MADTAKHTPGPWKYGVRKDKSIWLSLGDPVKGPHHQGDFFGTEKDAALTIAAPELLEALTELFESYKELSDSGDAGRWKLEKLAVGKKALAAISKAEGLA